ncbi:hypothetical protein ACOMHN_046192 [Nucella lapillus]
MAQQYSSMQKLSLAGMVIGAIMCLVGTCTPYWITSDPEGFGVFDIVGKAVKGSLGLFMVCLEVLGESGCKAIESSTDSGWFHTAQVGASGCVLLSLVCAGIAMCLACCGCFKRFFVLGILSFLAGRFIFVDFISLSGAYCIIVFSKHTKSFTGSILGFQMTSYGWSYFMFIGGVGLLGLVSFMACFTAPENPLRGMVLRPSAPSQVIVSSSTTTATTAGHHPYVHLQEQGPPPMMAATSGVTVVTANGY